MNITKLLIELCIILITCAIQAAVVTYVYSTLASRIATNMRRILSEIVVGVVAALNNGKIEAGRHIPEPRDAYEHYMNNGTLNEHDISSVTNEQYKSRVFSDINYGHTFGIAVVLFFLIALSLLIPQIIVRIVSSLYSETERIDKTRTSIPSPQELNIPF